MVKEEMHCCASCGTTGNDDVKLKDCSACHLMKYCSVKCQKDHRPQHKKECKKRAAELHDELLFKQPENTHISRTVQFVVCRYRLMTKNLFGCHVAANKFVLVAIIPIRTEKSREDFSTSVYFAANLRPKQWRKLMNE